MTNFVWVLVILFHLYSLPKALSASLSSQRSHLLNRCPVLSPSLYLLSKSNLIPVTSIQCKLKLLLVSGISNYLIAESVSTCTLQTLQISENGQLHLCNGSAVSLRKWFPQAAEITSARQPFICLCIIQGQLNRKQLTGVLFCY